MGFFKSLLKVATLGLVDLKTPKAPPIPELPPEPDTETAEVKKAGMNERRRAALLSTTILNRGGLNGDNRASGVAKRLLGQ